VHYGPAALNPTARLPVLFVFGKAPLDVPHVVATASELLLEGVDVLLVVDLAYQHAIGRPRPNLKGLCAYAN